jgi:hypothetical protein
MGPQSESVTFGSLETNCFTHLPASSAQMFAKFPIEPSFGLFDVNLPPPRGSNTSSMAFFRRSALQRCRGRTLAILTIASSEREDAGYPSA